MPKFSDTTKEMLVSDLTMTMRHLATRSHEVLAMLEKLHSSLEEGEEPVAINTALLDEMRKAVMIQEAVYLRIKGGRNALRQSRAGVELAGM